MLEGERVLGPAYNLIPGHERMKLVSQDYYVLDNHSVEENIFDKLVGYTNDAKSKRSARLLQLLELNALRNTRAKNLSSGQKQRVAIARALAVFPDLLLLDEPFSNLDHLLTEKLFAFITREAKKHRTAVILITHLSEEALKYADHIAVMDQGKIVQHGKKWQVYYQPKNSRLAGLMGTCNVIRPEDLENKKKKSKMLVRPDKISITSKADADLSLEVISSSYNGKCHEILCETRNGHSLMVYSIKQPEPGSRLYARINS